MVVSGVFAMLFLNRTHSGKNTWRRCRYQFFTYPFYWFLTKHNKDRLLFERLGWHVLVKSQNCMHAIHWQNWAYVDCWLAYVIVHFKSFWSNPAHPTKVVVSHATFSWWISQCKKSNKLIHYFQIYSWLKNPAIWLGGSNLANNLWTRNFRDMGFAQENR